MKAILAIALALLVVACASPETDQAQVEAPTSGEVVVEDGSGAAGGTVLTGTEVDPNEDMSAK